MRVHLTRRGGLAGVAVYATLDTAQLHASDAVRADAALRDLPWGRIPTAPTGADRFRYELRAEQGGHERCVELGETEIPDTLRPLVDLLFNHGRIGPGFGAVASS